MPSTFLGNYMDEDVVVWDDSFIVGYALLDDQHKKLVAMTNELIRGCKEGGAAAQESFGQAFEKAAEYAKTHFADEEWYLTHVLFPDLESHKKQHHKFLFDVVNLANEVESGNTAPIEMVRFLKNRLLNHIAVSDKQYAPYMKKIGRTGLGTLL